MTKWGAPYRLYSETNLSTFHPFHYSTLLTLHTSLFTLHFPVRPLTLTLSHSAYSLTRLVPRRFELASHKGRGKIFYLTNLSTFQLFNYLHSSLSPHFVILSLRIFGRVKQNGTRKVRVGRYSARTPNNPR